MNFIYKSIVFFGVSLLFLFGKDVSAQELTVKLSKNEIGQSLNLQDKFDEKQKITVTEVKLDNVPITSKLIKDDNFTLSSDENHNVKFIPGLDTLTFQIIGKTGPAKVIFKFKSPDTGTTFEFSQNIEVLPSIDTGSIKIVLRKKGANDGQEYSLAEGLKVLSNSDYEIKLIARNIQNDPITTNFDLTVEEPKVVTFGSAKQIKIKQTGDTFIELHTSDLLIKTDSVNRKVKITINNQPANEFTVTVFDKINKDSFRVRDLLEGDAPAEIKLMAGGESKIYLLDLVGNSGNTYTSENIPQGVISENFTNRKDLVNIKAESNRLIITPQKLPPGLEEIPQITLDLKVVQLGEVVAAKQFIIKIDPPIAVIEFEGGSSISLPKDSQATATAVVKDGITENKINAEITWDYADKEEGQKWFTISQRGIKATFIWKSRQGIDEKKRPNSVEVVAKANVDGKLITSTLVVSMFSVDRFALMKVRLNMLDRRTVRDLFGSVTDEEYYVISVRMLNNLKDEKTDDYLGASILVYNGSFEVAVILQKQYNKTSKSAKRDQAKRDKNKQTVGSYDDPERWFDVSDADLKNITGDFVDRTTEGKPTVKYGEETPCDGTIFYRPLTFEMAVNSVDPRDSRRFRTRLFRGLSLAGTVGSFLSSTKVLTGNSVVPVLDQYANLLLPGLEKIYPSLKEVHRQNVVSMAMKPIEEIPFGTDLTRVIFIPKKSIAGLLQDHNVRISQICPFSFKVEVAVIRRGDRTEVTNGRIP